jgi:tripartite-type tricarboxylate transporter receptor subunit TctC
VQAGRVRAVALAGPVRAPLLPDLPTFAESGYPGIDSPGWQAMWFPAGVARERAARIAQEVGKIVQLPEIKQRFQDAGLMTVGSTPAEFAAFIQRDLAFYTKLIRGAGIEPQ